VGGCAHAGGATSLTRQLMARQRSLAIISRCASGHDRGGNRGEPIGRHRTYAVAQ